MSETTTIKGRWSAPGPLSAQADAILEDAYAELQSLLPRLPDGNYPLKAEGATPGELRASVERQMARIRALAS